MARVFLIFCLLATVYCCDAENNNNFFEKILQHFGSPTGLNDTLLKITDFHWEDCEKDSPVHLSALAINSPKNSFSLPGEFQLTAAAKVDVALTAPIKVELKVYKKEVFWIKIPCDLVDGSNWCEISDFCAKLSFKDNCPDVMQKNHIPCHCPIPAGSYSLTNEHVKVSRFSFKHLPSWLVDGKYRIEVRPYLSNNIELGCGKFYVSVKIR